ncbi:MAG: hypothetical protein ABS89_04630 [Thiobacillus sp. SCN 63-1177]|nr:MAG: hypothetical protein ABS89_04630 [Thiobacillus sp. SCN 63-1177]
MPGEPIGMAGHTQARFVRHHVVGVMASDCEAIGLEVVDPFAATAASRAFIDINDEGVGGGPYRLCSNPKQQGSEEGSFHAWFLVTD